MSKVAYYDGSLLGCLRDYLNMMRSLHGIEFNRIDKLSDLNCLENKPTILLIHTRLDLQQWQNIKKAILNS